MALRAAASRHGTGERELQKLVDGGAFVDLRAVTREAIRTARAVDDLSDMDRYVGVTGLIDEAPLVAFDRWVADAATAGRLDDLVHYRERAPHARMAHPRDEHYLPLLVAAGAGGEGAVAKRLNDEFLFGNMSQAAFAFDAPERLAACTRGRTRPPPQHGTSPPAAAPRPSPRPPSRD